MTEPTSLHAHNTTFEEKQRVLRLLVDRIEINPNADGGTLYGLILLPQRDCTGLRLNYRDGWPTIPQPGLCRGGQEGLNRGARRESQASLRRAARYGAQGAAVPR